MRHRARWGVMPFASCRRHSPTSASTPTARRRGCGSPGRRATVCASASATASRSTPLPPIFQDPVLACSGSRNESPSPAEHSYTAQTDQGTSRWTPRRPAMVRVLLVDDDALVRAGLRIILSSAQDLDVVGEVNDGAHAVAAVREHRPDVVLMDIRMAELDGIAATAALRRLDPPPQVIVLTTFQADEQVMSALRAGASGFLVKDTPPAEIINAVRLVAAGDAIISPSVTRTLLAHFGDTRASERQRAAAERLATPPIANVRWLRRSDPAGPTRRWPPHCS